MVHTGALSGSPAARSEVRAALVRADGHIAWASGEPDDAILRAATADALAAA